MRTTLAMSKKIVALGRHRSHPPHPAELPPGIDLITLDPKLGMAIIDAGRCATRPVLTMPPRASRSTSRR